MFLLIYYCAYLCVCESFQSEQMAADGGALPCRRSALSRQAGLPIRDFTAWQPAEGCDLQGSVRLVALWLTHHSSLFSCQGCYTQYSRVARSLMTLQLIEKGILKTSCTWTRWFFICACITACLFSTILLR